MFLVISSTVYSSEPLDFNIFLIPRDENSNAIEHIYHWHLFKIMFLMIPLQHFMQN